MSGEWNDFSMASGIVPHRVVHGFRQRDMWIWAGTFERNGSSTPIRIYTYFVSSNTRFSDFFPVYPFLAGSRNAVFTSSS